MAIDAILTSRESIRAMDIDAVIAEFAAEIIKTINARGCLLEAVAIVAVFTEIRVHDEEAVLCESRIVDVFRILIRPGRQEVLCGGGLP